MAMFDKKLDFQYTAAASQAITAAAASGDVIDLGGAYQDAGQGWPIKVMTIVTTAFTHGGSMTSLRITLQGCDTAGGTYQDIGETEALVAELTPAGGIFYVTASPRRFRYIRMYYTPVGANATGGALRSRIVLDGPADYAFPDARTF